MALEMEVLIWQTYQAEELCESESNENSFGEILESTK